MKKIQEACDFLKKLHSKKPTIGVILGSGLGGFVSEIKVEKTIPYSDIPNFPVSTVEGHAGNLVFGTIGDKNIVAMQGRFHFYEGYSVQDTVFPVRVMKLLGVETLIASNASGGVREDFKVGDVMIINDHINLLAEHPLRGQNLDELGPRFVDMSEPYSIELIKKFESTAKKNNIEVKKGVYTILSGPTFETPAEYRLIKIIGSDAVGMSTVPEIIVAKHMGMKCFGISIITDLGGGAVAETVSHEEVQKAAKEAEPKLKLLIREFIKTI